MKGFFIVLLFVATVVGFPSAGSGATIAEQLKGRILLQVEARGEAWYVHPITMRRHYLGRPDDAFRVMRDQGLGITNSDLARIARAEEHGAGDDAFTKKFAGRILLQVQSRGEAWYVNPLTLRRYYLGRPADALAIMRSFGLGIANRDLEKVENEKSLIREDNDVRRIGEVMIDPSGTHSAYAIKKENGEAVIHDGKEGPTFFTLFRYLYPLDPKLIFSSDGRRLMYGGKTLDDGRRIIMVDGKEHYSTLEDIEAYGFSPDGQHTYVVEMANIIKLLDEGIRETDTLYIDGKKYETAFPSYNMKVPLFIQGTIIPIYWTGDHETGRLTLVIGEKKQGEYPIGSGDVLISLDGKHYALRSGGVLDKGQRVIMDGKQIGNTYEEVESLTLSVDGTTISFIGLRSGKKFFVKDGRERAF